MREERDGRRRGPRYYPYGGDRAGPLPPCVRQGELSVSLKPYRLGLGASSEGRAAVNHWPAEEWPCKLVPSGLRYAVPFHQDYPSLLLYGSSDTFWVFSCLELFHSPCKSPPCKSAGPISRPRIPSNPNLPAINVRDDKLGPDLL